MNSINKSSVLLSLNSAAALNDKQKKLLAAAADVYGEGSEAYADTEARLMDGQDAGAVLRDVLSDDQAKAFSVVAPDPITLAHLVIGSPVKIDNVYVGRLRDCLIVDAFGGDKSKTLRKGELGKVANLSGVGLGNKLKKLKADGVVVEEDKLYRLGDAKAIEKVGNTAVGKAWAKAQQAEAVAAAA
jgi:hypothetical protein